MKIGIFMEQFGLGGVEVQLANLINNWPAADDEFILITNRDNKGIELFSSIIKNSHKIVLINKNIYHYLNNKNIKWIKKYILLLLQYVFFVIEIFRLATTIKRYDFDIFISDNGGYPASDSCRAAVLASFICGIKRRYLIVHHAAVPPTKWRRGFEWLIDMMLQEVVEKIITVSEASKQALLFNRSFNKKVEVIYNGIDESMISTKGIDLRSFYKINVEKKIIGIMGNMDFYKGHAVMIEAAPLILSGYPHTHFIFVGSLYDSNWQKDNADRVNIMIEKMNLKEHITITGYLKGNSQEIINQFDILAMPTLDFEGFGLVLAEAMILKKPIVASRVGAIPEVVVDEQSGILVAPGDSVVLAEATCRLLGDPALVDQLGKYARQRYEEKFTGNIMAHKYFDMIMGKID